MRQSHFVPKDEAPVKKGFRISTSFSDSSDVIVHLGDSETFLKTLPSDLVALIISSPPYNIGKEYETRTELDKYLERVKPVLRQLVRVLSPQGSLCWQVGNFVDDGEVYPLDIYYYPILKDLGLKLRNRVVWHFGHGLHASRRFSGRYETILWFSKTEEYVFNLDAIRIPSKYPGKRYYKGPKVGQPSANPLGKNPSDFWEFIVDEWDRCVWDIPNVKANHPEKTQHPCQFPVELVERCVLAFTREGEWVLDPYGGVGSAAIAALKNKRRAVTVDRDKTYATTALKRIADLEAGRLPTRKMGTPVYQPTGREKVSQVPKEWRKGLRRNTP